MRSRTIFKGGKPIAEFRNGELAWCADEYIEPERKSAEILPDLPGYESPVTGLWVEGRAARREDLKRAGCREWEGLKTEQQEAARHRAYEAIKSEQRLDETAWRSWYQLSPDKRRALRQR